MSGTDASIDVVILAGGKGTRLQSVVADVPKPLAPVGGRPFLDYQFAQLRQMPGRGKVVLAIGHLAERVIAHYNAHRPMLDLAFSIEARPLGTGGGLRNALGLTTSRQILVLNGDSIFHWDIGAICAAHQRCAARATLSLLEVEDVSRYGSVSVEGGRVTSFFEKSREPRPGLINAGVYLFERDAVAAILENENVSLEQQVLPALAEAGALAAAPFRSDFIDIGLPETYKLASTLVPRLFPQE